MDKFYKNQNNLTAAKIDFYQNYIEVYLIKLLMGFGKCFIADLFCGAGKNGDKQGSPLILIDRARYALNVPRLKDNSQIYILFNDKNKSIDAESIDLIIYYYGNSFSILKNELEKIYLYFINDDNINLVEFDLFKEDISNNVFEISGRSYPEDTAEFYIPILEWVDSYVKTPNEKTTFSFKLDYFNSSSYKPFLDILLRLGEIKKKGFDVSVEWCSKDGDLDIKEAGEEFAEIVDIPFSYSVFK